MRTLFLLLLLFSFCAGAAEGPLGFDEPAKQQRFQGLVDEIRCLVCQNQSLADSNADLARDLRLQIHRMVEEGMSNEEILDFLVTRYGDFVLYRPPLKATTLLLWFGPFLLLLGGLAAVYLIVKSRRAGEVTLTPDEQAALSRIMDEDAPAPGKADR